LAREQGRKEERTGTDQTNRQLVSKTNKISEGHVKRKSPRLEDLLPPY